VKRLSSHIVDFHIRRLVSDMGRSSVKGSCLFKQFCDFPRQHFFFNSLDISDEICFKVMTSSSVYRYVKMRIFSKGNIPLELFSKEFI